MKIEIKKITEGDGDVYFAAYKEDDKLFITNTCFYTTTNRTEEQAMALCEKAAKSTKSTLTTPKIETIKTIEI